MHEARAEKTGMPIIDKQEAASVEQPTRVILTAVCSSDTFRVSCGARAGSSGKRGAFCGYGVARAAPVKNSTIPGTTLAAPVEHAAARGSTRVALVKYYATLGQATAISSQRRLQGTGSSAKFEPAAAPGPRSSGDFKAAAAPGQARAAK